MIFDAEKLVKYLLAEDGEVEVSGGKIGELTKSLRDELLGIQLGEVEDKHNWMWKVCD